MRSNGSRPPIDFSRLPPSVAASLAKLSGRPLVPAPSEEQATPGNTGPDDGKPPKA